MIDFNALFKISYGLYIVSSGDKKEGNGFISNSVFQITSTPAKFILSCNRDNYTSELIEKYKKFSVSVLGVDTPSEIFGTFGYKSGKDIDKFKGLDIKYSDLGVPIVLNSAIAYLEFNVCKVIEEGTHILFIGELVNSEVLNDSEEPITYSYYKNIKKGLVPKNAPTYVDKTKLEKQINLKKEKKYKCLVCGYIYDNSEEDVDFELLPEDWACPICGAEKSDFEEIN